MKRKNSRGKGKAANGKKTNGNGSRRGFAAMSKSKVRQIASMGGRASRSSDSSAVAIKNK